MTEIPPTSTEPGVQIIDIVVEAHEYVPELEKEIKNLSHSVQIPGFRPGKVPRSLILKRFGNALVRDLTLHKAYEKLNQHIQTGIGRFILSPILVHDSSEHPDASQPIDYQFTFEVAPLPHFEVALPPLGEIEWQVDTVNEEKVDKEIHRLRDTYGQVKLLQEAELEKDIIVGSVIAIATEGSSPFENKYISFRVGDIQKEALSQVLPLLKQGNTVSFQPGEWFVTSEDNFSRIFKEIDRAFLERPDLRWELTISQIIRHIPAPLSEEFFRNITHSDNVKTEEEFRAFIRRRLEKRNFTQARRKAQLALKEWLVTQNLGRFNLPERLIKLKVSSMSKDPLSEAEMEERVKEQKEAVGWEVILENLKENLNINISSDDLEQAINELAFNEASKYPGSLVTRDLIDKLREKIREENKKKGFVDVIVLETKVLDRLLETVVQGYEPYQEK